MANKNSFVFYTEWLDTFKRLAERGTAEDMMALCDGIKAYVESGEEVELTLAAEMAFCSIKNQIARDTAKYEETSQRRKEAREKANKADKGEQTLTNADKPRQTLTNATEYEDEYEDDNDDVDENDNDNDNESPIGDVSLSVIGLPAPTFVGETDPKRMTDSVLDEEFDALWSKYPRRVGKKDALRHYKAARKEAIRFEDIDRGLDKYIEYCRGKPEQYIMQGSTWFCGHHWDDERHRQKSDFERIWDL